MLYCPDYEQSSLTVDGVEDFLKVITLWSGGLIELQFFFHPKRLFDETNSLVLYGLNLFSITFFLVFSPNKKFHRGLTLSRH